MSINRRGIVWSILATSILATLCLWQTGCGASGGDVSAKGEPESSGTSVAAETDQLGNGEAGQSLSDRTHETTPAASAETTELVLAGGCFWCMEVAFEQLQGVTDVVSGYAGGTEETADYQTVSAGLTRHAEAIRITYDPSRIREEQLLAVFFLAAHDPTQINRQLPDVGRQYRSAVFYDSDEQKERAAAMIAELNESGQFDKKIATALEPLAGFYPAEDYHQDYVKHHPHEPYVVHYSIPKRDKVRKEFPKLIHAEATGR